MLMFCLFLSVWYLNSVALGAVLETGRSFKCDVVKKIGNLLFTVISASSV